MMIDFYLCCEVQFYDDKFENKIVVLFGEDGFFLYDGFGQVVFFWVDCRL